MKRYLCEKCRITISNLAREYRAIDRHRDRDGKMCCICGSSASGSTALTEIDATVEEIAPHLTVVVISK